MMMVVLTATLTIILHELGHIICIVIFNITEGRRICDFSISVSFTSIFISHMKFKKPYKNLIVALSGSVFPLFVAAVLTVVFHSQFTAMMLLLAILNLLFLHPKFPDGKNVLNSINEMRG